MLDDQKILLVGGGKMGGAMLSGWLEQGVASDAVRVVEPNVELRAAFVERGIIAIASLDDLDAGFTPGIVVLAVKPQVMEEVLPPYQDLVGSGVVFLSIAAGKPVSFFAKILGPEAAIVRAMPNTPAAVQRGVTALFANAKVSDDQKGLCKALLAAVGSVHWIDDEGLMDAVTAVSGSGPAYVFHMVEAMAGAGVAAGLPEDLAMALARDTVAGSGELLHQADDDAATLRRNVTSPGGTTAAALEVLMADEGLAALMRRAVAAAKTRSRELAG